MNAREEWPLPSETPEWWRDRPLTPEEQDAMADDYQREQIASAQSEAAQEAARKEYAK